MASYALESLATAHNFDESAYLRGNPDVARAVAEGQLKSGRAHFDSWGYKEGRKLRLSPPLISEAKARKLARIGPLLRLDLPHVATPSCYDFLTDDLRARFNILDTEAVGANDYDAHVQELIQKRGDGLLLDCGAGRRSVYYDSVVNLDVVDYDTTDVLAVGEVLPFVDASFDAVISVAVLEHVKDPFACAREIARVLKPGGSLFCRAAFLQPVHGYPNHYYNMTSQGLSNLFVDSLTIDKVFPYEGRLPIHALTWILRSWADGLQGKTRDQFLKLRVADLLGNAEQYSGMPFVKELSQEKNEELASGIVLLAHK